MVPGSSARFITWPTDVLWTVAAEALGPSHGLLSDATRRQSPPPRLEPLSADQRLCVTAKPFLQTVFIVIAWHATFPFCG